MKLDLNMETLKEFALDVWEDLGRTRLAGVAVGLGLALLAITAIVFHPSGAPNVHATTKYAAATAATPAAQDEVSFAVPGEKPLKISDVDLSAPRDPFRNLDGVTAGAGGDQTLLPAADEVQDVALGSSDGSSPAPTGVSSAGYDDASSLLPLDDLSDDPEPVPSDDTANGELGDEPKPSDPESPAVSDYSYAADIQFGRVNDLKRYAQVQRLGLVPSRSLPLLMYLGVSTDHRTAVFMVDSRLSQGGEGHCVPKESLCTFLELRATPDQDEHHFKDADGNEYLLRLRRLVRTDTASGSLSGRSVSQLDGTPPVVDGTR